MESNELGDFRQPLPLTLGSPIEEVAKKIHYPQDPWMQCLSFDPSGGRQMEGRAEAAKTALLLLWHI